MSKEKVETEVVNEVKEVAVKPVRKETVQEKNNKIFKEHIIKDKNGLNSFVDEDALAEKMLMSVEETQTYLNGADPSIYFAKGRMPIWLKKEMGVCLDDERVEKEALDKLISKDLGVLMFKHEMLNLYQILVPKVLSEFELDYDGEFIEKYTVCHRAVVNFNSATSTKEYGPFPASFEPSFFEDYTRRTLSPLKARAASKNLTKII